MKLAVLVFSAFLLLSSSEKEENLSVKSDYRAFKTGEFLRYNIHYGPVNAGEATFYVLDSLQKVADKPHFKVRVTGRSYSSWDYFYKVRDYYYSYIDTQTMLPTAYSRNVSEGSFEDKESYFFNRKKNIAKGKSNGEKVEIEIPDDVQDLASMIYYARAHRFHKMEVGSSLPIKVFFGKEWFESSAVLVGREEVKTKLGTFRCLKILPQLVKGRVFKGQDDMEVFVTDDKNLLPIQIKSKIFVGSIKVDLAEYKNLKFPMEAKID